MLARDIPVPTRIGVYSNITAFPSVIFRGDFNFKKPDFSLLCHSITNIMSFYYKYYSRQTQFRFRFS